MIQETASPCLEIEAPETTSLRVLAVVPGDMTGSSFIFARRQISALVSLGLNVRTFNFKERTSLKGLFREWQRLRRDIRLFQPDIVHAHYGTITALLCGLAFSSRLVISYRGSDLNGSPGTGFLRRYAGIAFSQLAALRADAIICVSIGLRQKLWWRRKKASILPSGVDIQAFRPMATHEARTMLGWEQDGSIVLFNAGAEPELKGLSLARQSIEAANRLTEPVRLFVINGEIEPSQMPLYINAANCVLLCSVNEGSPNIVKEALACSVPVVALNVGDVENLLAGVLPSAIVAHRNPEEIGKAVARVLKDGSRSNGRTRIARMSSGRVAESTCEIYMSICKPC